MGTAKYQMDAKRQAAVAAAEEAHLGPPPTEPDLLEATLVIPGKHMLPRGLDDPTALNDVRKKHKVWITRVQPNVFELRSKHITRLQEAIKDINWCIHDMRLSSENLTTRFLVQEPANAPKDALVKVELNSRPHVLTVKATRGDIAAVAKDLCHQLQASLVPSTDILRALGADLRMRVNIGRLEVRQRKKGLGQNMSYADFSKMIPQYSIRGGASLISRLSDVHHAYKVVQHLQNPVVGILGVGIDGVPRRCTVFLKVRDQELVATTQAPTGKHPELQLSAARIIRREKWPRLNWTVAAPDMQLDWNLQVDSCESTASIPADLRGIMERLKLTSQGAEDNKASMQSPRLVLTRPGGDEVEETILKTSVLLPFRDTPFLVEISVSQAWPQMMTHREPETWWGIEFYGKHWSEAINNVSPGERRKYWGEGLRNIWPGGDASLEDRFLEFLQHVVKIQAALGGVDWDANMPQKEA
ncbi:hypothetical protein HRG_007780 [Hirsutella rhossiliensis]|uniref:DUF7905 domain-containing protein n=1 Tax=Hirsutella rhossiliensis TaxID=111463 RepID=A0A9P8MWU4_9HYPO|nr:uncharacterized protein HRG_07780 [Hirsutella rhossiliensis]KAH0960627.1 hypothetical protein HRG_07780 [Hirsutella rhossiliensis]